MGRGIMTEAVLGPEVPDPEVARVRVLVLGANDGAVETLMRNLGAVPCSKDPFPCMGWTLAVPLGIRRGTLEFSMFAATGDGRYLEPYTWAGLHPATLCIEVVDRNTFRTYLHEVPRGTWNSHIMKVLTATGTCPLMTVVHHGKRGVAPTPELIGYTSAARVDDVEWAFLSRLVNHEPFAVNDAGEGRVDDLKQKLVETACGLPHVRAGPPGGLYSDLAPPLASFALDLLKADEPPVVPLASFKAWVGSRCSASDAGQRGDSRELTNAVLQHLAAQGSILVVNGAWVVLSPGWFVAVGSALAAIVDKPGYLGVLDAYSHLSRVWEESAGFTPRLAGRLLSVVHHTRLGIKDALGNTRLLGLPSRSRRSPAVGTAEFLATTNPDDVRVGVTVSSTRMPYRLQDEIMAELGSFVTAGPFCPGGLTDAEVWLELDSCRCVISWDPNEFRRWSLAIAGPPSSVFNVRSEIMSIFVAKMFAENIPWVSVPNGGMSCWCHICGGLSPVCNGTLRGWRKAKSFFCMHCVSEDVPLKVDDLVPVYTAMQDRTTVKAVLAGRGSAGGGASGAAGAGTSGGVGVGTEMA